MKKNKKAPALLCGLLIALAAVPSLSAQEDELDKLFPVFLFHLAKRQQCRAEQFRHGRGVVQGKHQACVDNGIEIKNVNLPAHANDESVEQAGNQTVYNENLKHYGRAPDKRDIQGR